jgi:hypothetical protein
MARSSHPSRLIVADVSSKEEFIDAFNGFDGVIAVFDGHGSQDPDGTGGIVSIGSIKLNPFELYAKLRVPPILILSACETYTFEGYESSVASAFLLMGCDSVLGTLAPIDAFQAAALVARFVFRLSDFLPLIEHVVPWSQVVSGMLRMTYVTDLLHAMKARYSLAEERFKKLHNSVQLSANLDINSLRADWLERAFDSISQELAQPRSDIVNTWREKCYFTETLRYIHLGQPEHIFITPDSSPSTTSGFPFAPRGG